MAEFMSTRELHWRIGDETIDCRIEETKGQGTFSVSETSLPFRILDSSHIEIAGKIHRFYVTPNRDSITVWLDGRTYFLRRAKTATDIEAAPEAGTGEVRALMPGKLLRLSVAVGDNVNEKQPVAIMESMKMESTLVAPVSGKVSEIRFQAGQVVEMGELVMVIS
jgi:acetyl/propionyl-CoA carboxylase alpha subunit